MRIVIIGPAHPFRGGIATYNERLAKAFQADGHEVDIVTFTKQYPKFLFPGKTQFSESPTPQDIHIKRMIHAYNPLNWIKTGRKLQKAQYDLVIVRYWLPLMGPALGTILRSIKKNNYSKIIALVDNMIPHEKRPGDQQFSQYFVQPIDGFMAMTESVVHDIKKFVSQKPISLSPHPLFDNFGKKIGKEQACKHLKLDPNDRYILFFGLIRKYKGLDWLLEAFAQSNLEKENIKIIVAGEYYTDSEYYQEIIKKHQLESAVLQYDYFIPDEEVKYFFNACDVVVQPYKSATQSGVTQIAYHFEIPMIVTRVGGLEEMCPDKKVGFVSEPNTEALSEKLNAFFSPENHINFEKNIQIEKKKFAWDVLCKKFYELYQKL
ncbi:MAG: glycosyltransferase [Flavobacteriales bacterium]|jgi:glycosyltransferase involved in cell wall biosynthesis|nr:glycosyltransferase [Flavobacteriales bacterium]